MSLTSHLRTLKLLSFIAALLLTSYALAGPTGSKKTGFTITGTSGIPDTTVEVKIFYDYFISRDDQDASTYSARALHGKFSITVPPIVKPAYMSISLIPKIGRRSVLYFIEPGDHVQVEYKRGKLTFAGKDGRKMQCQQELYALSKQYYTKGDPKLTTDLTKYQRKKWQLHKADSLSLIRKDVINRYKAYLSPLAYQQLQLDCLSDLYLGLYEQTFGSLYYSHDSIQKVEARAYRDFYAKRTFGIKGANHVTSRSYTALVIQKLKSDLWVNAYLSEGKGNHATLKRLVNHIKVNYTGLLKDKLVTVASIELFHKNEDAAGILQQYLKGKVYSPYKEMLVRLKSAKSPGSPVVNFEFLNEQGRTVQLADFKGKAVVVNLWTSGCYHCVELATRMREIKKSIEALGPVVFVTVSVDRDRDLWVSSVNRGIFTEKENVNLFTGGKGLDHPFMMYYNYAAMPAQMIINTEGRLVTMFPSRPIDEPSTAVFLQQVKKAMQ